MRNGVGAPFPLHHHFLTDGRSIIPRSAPIIIFFIKVRASGLIRSLESKPAMYDFRDYAGRKAPNLYTDRMIYSPQVPVFRGDDTK